MNDPAARATESFTRWAQAFNNRDADAMVAEMHFPHMRLAGNKFQAWHTSEDFRVPQDSMTEMLNKEGWHTTVTKSITAVQAGAEKVHLVIRQSRQHADGIEYNGFDTLWVFTLIDGRWGVQFRSSFLENAVQAVGASEPSFQAVD
ncbi:MAG: hypothetical protein O3B95_04410 [Chloroflexi bacterium]|nr:hypothetical protein [Chloroflexota bacterium]